MAANYIAEEIWMEILLKLPAGKWLIRATSVCKAWKSLIRSPSFISLHLANSENRVFVRNREHYTLFPKKENANNSSNWPLVEFPKSSIGYYKIVASCNGLMCLSNELVVPSVVIWNPCIRNYVFLPKSHLINRNQSLCVVLGFGVAAASNVYKVVRLVFYRKDYYSFIGPPPQAEIFTLGGDRWRKLVTGGIDAGVYHPNPTYSWFFNGFVHWIAYDFKDGRNDYVYSNLILTFYVGDEVFGEIVLPEELKRANVATLAKIGSRESSFGVIDNIWEMGNIVKCNVWIMKDYGVKESWTKLYSIAGIFGRVIGILENSEYLLQKEVDTGFFTYNAKTKGIKHARVFKSSGCSCYVDDFKESLVLLGGGGESGETSTI